MEHRPDGGEPGVEFILPRRDKVHAENWDEYAADGWEWTGRNDVLDGKPYETHTDIRLDAWVVTGGAGPENVATGDPFDVETGRPVHRPGEYGVYWRPPHD